MEMRLLAVIMDMAVFIVIVVASLIFDRPSLLFVFAQRRRARLAGAAATVGACADASADAKEENECNDNREYSFAHSGAPSSLAYSRFENRNCGNSNR